MESKVFLITGATGDTGSKAARFLLEKRHKVRAFVHKNDSRSRGLAELGAEIVVGDLLDFKTVRGALVGVSGAYFVYPIAPDSSKPPPFSRRPHVKPMCNMS
jgi:NAD(P)H dehydrogenase (quinone)